MDRGLHNESSAYFDLSQKPFDSQSSSRRDLDVPTTSQDSLVQHQDTTTALPGHFSADAPVLESLDNLPFLTKEPFRDPPAYNNAVPSLPASSAPTYDANPSMRGLFWKGRYFGLSHWMNSVGQVR